MATWILRWFNENIFWVFVNRENQCQQIRGLLQTYHKIKIGGRRKTRLQTKEKCKNFLKEFPSAFKTIRWFKKKQAFAEGARNTLRNQGKIEKKIWNIFVGSTKEIVGFDLRNTPLQTKEKYIKKKNYFLRF